MAVAEVARRSLTHFSSLELLCRWKGDRSSLRWRRWLSLHSATTLVRRALWRLSIRKFRCRRNSNFLAPHINQNDPDTILTFTSIVIMNDVHRWVSSIWRNNSEQIEALTRK